MLAQSNYTLRNYKAISNMVLISTYLIVLAVLLLLIISLTLDHARMLNRLAVCGFAVLYVTATQLLARHKNEQLLAYANLVFYFLLASIVMWNWGINNALGVLIFGLVIVLAGILLTARHALFAALITTIALLGVQSAFALGWHEPNAVIMSNTSSYGDVLAYCIVFGMIALITWQYDLETERSLAHAKRAELALLQQKATLEDQVKSRTAQLRQAQLEEKQQMYRFTELGQLGVTMLHDMANYLAALTLEVEDLQSQQHSKTVKRVRQIIRYLDDIVITTRERLHHGAAKQSFDIIQNISKTIGLLQYKAHNSNVIIDWQSPAGSWKYAGDPESFSQLISIVTNNAIDAASKITDPDLRRVGVVIRRTAADIIIRISDSGKGIPEGARLNLFAPKHSGKKSGLGIGLYIAKQIAEMQFSGTITLSPQNDKTEFIITLPRHPAKN